MKLCDMRYYGQIHSVCILYVFTLERCFPFGLGLPFMSVSHYVWIESMIPRRLNLNLEKDIEIYIFRNLYWFDYGSLA